MNERAAGGTGVEEIISELHERGVRSGREESERIVAEARVKSAEIIKAAEEERARIIQNGQLEAERVEDAARLEAAQMLESFMASLPDIFAKRASHLLEEILADTFAPDRSCETISNFVSFFDGDAETQLKAFFKSAKPRSFVEGLLVMALVFYTETRGFDSFTIDSGLKERLASLLADPSFKPDVQYEFRDGIGAFSVKGRDGREVIVSPESVKHMAEAWAGEEFRDVYVNLRPAPQPPGEDHG